LEFWNVPVVVEVKVDVKGAYEDETAGMWM
jgi:hypothetical protein